MVAPHLYLHFPAKLKYYKRCKLEEIRVANPSMTLIHKIGKEGDRLMLTVTKGEKKPQSTHKLIISLVLSRMGFIDSVYSVCGILLNLIS